MSVSPQTTPAEPRPLVLLSNDDGHLAEGIQALAVALRTWADVVICAPETEQSTTSHSLSLYRPLRLKRVAPQTFAVDGTPADCVYVALHAKGRILPRWPDLIVSGMNHGLNLASDVFYSGTVAAAREGAMRNIPALAASADPAADRTSAAEVCAAIARELLLGYDADAPAPLLNVNVPPGRIWPVTSTRLGKRLYEDVVEFRSDPRGREYMWIGGGFLRHDHLAGSDTEAHDAGSVSITPLLLDLTSAQDGQLSSHVARAVNRL